MQEKLKTVTTNQRQPVRFRAVPDSVSSEADVLAHEFVALIITMSKRPTKPHSTSGSGPDYNGLIHSGLNWMLSDCTKLLP